MKFSHKLALSIVALLGLLFTLGGSLLVYQVFKTDIDSTVRHNTNQHILEKYALEADMLFTASEGYPLNGNYFTRYGERFSAYMGAPEQLTALYGPAGETLYSNLPPGLAPEAAAVLSQTGPAVL